MSPIITEDESQWGGVHGVSSTSIQSHSIDNTGFVEYPAIIDLHSSNLAP